MGDDPPETEAADVKESDEEDKDKGKEEEPCICGRCMSWETHNKAKEKDGRGKGSGTTGARPKPRSKIWKMLVPSNFRRRPQPYENNVRAVDKCDFVWLPDEVKGFRVRKEA